MSETFKMPPTRPATAADPKTCEHDLGTTGNNECRKPATVAVDISGEAAGYGRARSWGFCSQEHARAECEILWGIGFAFPQEV